MKTKTSFLLSAVIAIAISSFTVHAAPIAITLPAVGVVNKGALLYGLFIPNSLPTTAWFEWGRWPAAYDQQTAIVAAGSGTTPIYAFGPLTNQVPGLIYHYRVVADNFSGTAFGSDFLFGAPIITLNGAPEVTIGLHTTFVDPGASARDFALAIAAGDSFGLAARVDGSVRAWGAGTANTGIGSSYGQSIVPPEATNVTALSAGRFHSLALREDHSVLAWGAGTNNTAISPTFGQSIVPPGLANVTGISGGAYHSLAVRSDGTVAAWGAGTNISGAFHHGQSIVPADLTNAVSVAGGFFHSLALKENGDVAAWGAGTTDTGIEPAFGQSIVPSAANASIAIAAGAYHNLSLHNDGTVFAWGAGTNNTGVSPSYGQSIVPPEATNVIAVAAGLMHSLALRADGTIVAWGAGTNTIISAPYDYRQSIVPAEATNVVAIACGAYHSMALRGDGTIIAWGRNNSGESTVPADVNAALPVSIGGSVNTNAPGTYTLTYSVTNFLGGVGTATRKVVVVNTTVETLPATGVSNNVAQLNGTVTPNGNATTAWFEWGLTPNIYSDQTTPVVLGSGFSPISISNVLTSLTPGLLYHGRIVASNASGVINGNDVVFGSPDMTLNDDIVITNAFEVPFIDPGAFATDFTLAIAAGADHELALRADGSVVAWGITNGGTAFGQSVAPANATGMVAIGAGRYLSMAIREDGSILAWGNNSSGMTNVPVTATNAIAVTGGEGHAVALRADGSCIVWGNNNYAQQNVPDGAMSNVISIAASGWHSLALRSDGAVVAWGAGTNNTGVNLSYGQSMVPAEATNVIAIAAGLIHSLALRADGSVVAWGAGTNDTGSGVAFGQSIVPAAALSNVVGIGAGASHSLALMSDGSIVSWGRYSPETYIPDNLTNVTAVAGGSAFSTALFSDSSIAVWGPVSSYLKDTPTNLLAGLTVSVNGVVDTGIPGTYELTYTATNSIGGVGTITRTVIVSPSTVTVFAAATTLPATGVSNDVAQLNGLVNPNGGATTAWFEWGFSKTRYSNQTTPVPLGSGEANLSISNVLTGLIPGHVYYARVVAENGAGKVYGRDVAFGVPAITLSGGPVVTNLVGEAFIDPGASAEEFIVAIDAGQYFNLLLLADGSVKAWGYGTSGQTNIPANVSNVVAIAAGEEHNLALRSDNEVIPWGYIELPLPAIASNQVEAIYASGYFSMALMTNGSVVAWGVDNTFGQADPPPDLTNALAIAGGNGHALAIRADGSVTAWGAGLTNEPGGGTYGIDLGQSIIPDDVSNAVAIAAGERHSMALQSDGTVHAWGSGSFGQTNIPENVSNIVAIGAGTYHCLAVKDDGTVIAWGDNGSSQTNVPGNVSNVVAVAGGQAHSLALRSDGTVAAWGSTYSGVSTVPSDLNTPLVVNISGSVDTNTPGIYELTYTAVNGLGGIATVTRTVIVSDGAPVEYAISGVSLTPEGTFKISQTNLLGTTFGVLAATNLFTPLTNWTYIGNMGHNSPGVYSFTDHFWTNGNQRFYYIITPGLEWD